MTERGEPLDPNVIGGGLMGREAVDQQDFRLGRLRLASRGTGEAPFALIWSGNVLKGLAAA